MIEFHIMGSVSSFSHVVSLVSSIVERFDGGDPSKLDLNVRVAEEHVDAFTDACDDHDIFCEML